MFTGLRFVQGFSAAAGMVLSMAIVRDRYEGLAVSKVMARLMLVVGVAPILAPTIGAQLLRFGSWRLIFVFLAVVGAILLVVSTFALKESCRRSGAAPAARSAALRTYRDLLTDLPFLGLALMSAFYLGAMFTYVASSTFVFQDGFGMTAAAVRLGVRRRRGRDHRRLAGQRCAGRPVHARAGAQRHRRWSGWCSRLSLFATTLADGPLWLVVTLLVLTLGTAGFVLPSAPAIALADNPHRAGSAAALLGALQFGLGALIAPLTSIGGTPTAETMAGRDGRARSSSPRSCCSRSAARGAGSPSTAAIDGRRHPAEVEMAPCRLDGPSSGRMPVAT